MPLLQFAFSATDKRLDVTLNGNFNAYERPHFKLDALSGAYQADLEQWLNAEIVLFVIAISYMVRNGFSPFLYFRF